MLRMKFIAFFAAAFLCTTGLFAQDTTITPERKKAIDSLALEKVKDLSKYIALIGNKQTAVAEANRIVERAAELFAPDAKIAVSSLSGRTKTYAIREYFQRLMALNYTQVNINWFTIKYISDLERQPNGKFVGVATIFQKFEGMNNDKIRYTDVTKKNVTLYVDEKNTQVSGSTLNYWDVQLGDIKVTETKRK